MGEAHGRKTEPKQMAVVVKLSILNAVIPTPIWMYFVFIILFVLIIAAFALHVMGLRKWAPEYRVFWDARKNRLPILEISDISERAELYLGVKQEKGSVQFLNTDFGIQLDPRILAQAPTTRLNGIQKLNYSTRFSFPISGKNARALRTCIDHVRSKHKHLNLIGDIEIMTLLGKDDTELEHDCINVLSSIMQQEDMIDITPGSLANDIRNIRKELMTAPIQTGFFSYVEAFKLIPCAMLSQDFHAYKLELERLIRKEMSQDMQKILIYAIAFVIIIVGGVVGYRMTG